TSPVSAPSNVAIRPQTQARQQKPRVVESFSLSEEDLVAMNDPLLHENAQSQQKFSPGFVERLKRGEELKVNALGLDYGQYIVRMRERLAQRWNPQKTITPAMYDYREIIVTLAVVLNDRGELVDLRVIN